MVVAELPRLLDAKFIGDDAMLWADHCEIAGEAAGIVNSNPAIVLRRLRPVVLLDHLVPVLQILSALLGQRLLDLGQDREAVGAVPLARLPMPGDLNRLALALRTVAALLWPAHEDNFRHI